MRLRILSSIIGCSSCSVYHGTGCVDRYCSDANTPEYASDFSIVDNFSSFSGTEERGRAEAKAQACARIAERVIKGAIRSVVSAYDRVGDRLSIASYAAGSVFEPLCTAPCHSTDAWTTIRPAGNLPSG